MLSSYPATPDVTRGKILVADDEAEICDLLREFLMGKGYEVITVVSGEEALVKARQERPDAILLDVRMPDMSGLDVLRAIRAMGKAVYVVMVTALDDKAIRQEALRLGADDYVTKPFRLRDLEARLASRSRADQAWAG
ncbi:MAG: response regulator [Nitrospinae bacterium]|nr:response regulator [Nitrospinota bacterium]